MSCPVHVMSRPCHVQTMSCPVHVMSSPCHVQSMSCPVHVMSRPCHVQSMSCPVHLFLCNLVSVTKSFIKFKWLLVLEFSSNCDCCTNWISDSCTLL